MLETIKPNIPLSIEKLSVRNMEYHGMRRSKLYDRWSAIIQRCTNIKNKRYKDYGARGITICDRWRNSFENFMDDMLPTYQEELSLDRIDNDKGYSPDNCRWVSILVQNRNTRLLCDRNTSGYRGVNWNKTKSRWIAQISVDNKKKHLGNFLDALSAAKAYDQYVIDNNLEHTINGVL